MARELVALQAVQTLRCVAFVLTLLSAGLRPAAADPLYGVPDSVAWSFDLGGDPARIRKAITDLLDPDPAVWHEAQIRLAVAGELAISELNRSTVIRDSVGASRIKPIVSLALCLHLRPETLDQYSRARGLGEVEIQRGLALADSLSALKSLVTENIRLGWMISDLGGFKAYAGRELLADPRPVGRAFGAHFLRDIEPAREALSKLLQDQTPVGVSGSDWHKSSTVAERVEIRARRGSQRRSDYFESIVSKMNIADGTDHVRAMGMKSGQPEPPWFSDWTNVTRETSHSREAQTWDEWWGAARPAWKRWWEMAGDGLYPADRQEWFNYVNEMDGYRYTSRPDSLGRSILHVTGPAGTRYEIFRDSVLVSAGVLPLHSIGPPDPVLAEDWKYTFPDAKDLVEIRLRFSDGTSRIDWWPWNGEEMTIVILGSQRRVQ